MATTLLVGPAIGQTPVLRADLVVHFGCAAIASADLENAIELTLRRLGFEVLNVGRLRREHGVPSNLSIVALDKEQRTIEVLDLSPQQKGDYVLRLNTVPPTKRATALENRLENFVAREMACEVRRITRSENSVSAKPLHKSEVARIKQLFHEAETLQGKQRS